MKGWRPVIGFALLGALLAGCGGGGGGGRSHLEDAEVRYINASVDTPALDFIVNDRVEAAALPYGEGNPSGFRSLKKETYDIFLRPTGAIEDAWAETFDAVEGDDHVLAGFGLQNFGEEISKRLRLAKVLIDRTAPNGNKARLYVLNAFNRAVGFENVPVDFKNPGENPQFQITDIAFGEAQPILVDSGDQTFDVRLNGAEQVYVSETLHLGAGKVYFVILGGIEGGAGVQAPDIKLVELATEAP